MEKNFLYSRFSAALGTNEAGLGELLYTGEWIPEFQGLRTPCCVQNSTISP